MTSENATEDHERTTPAGAVRVGDQVWNGVRWLRVVDVKRHQDTRVTIVAPADSNMGMGVTLARDELLCVYSPDYRSDQVREHRECLALKWTWAEEGGHRRSARLTTVRGFPMELRTAGASAIVRDLTHARELVQGFAHGLPIVAPNGAPLWDRAWLTQSRYLGADAALAAASWLILSEHQARGILDDVDPEVVDSIREPNLSGEFADDLTPDLLAEEVGLTRDQLTVCPDGREVVDAIATAWEEGRDLVWWDAVQATALRTLGNVTAALAIEQGNERQVDDLRKAAGL